MIFISKFVDKCPQCNTQYELLATVTDWHIIHDVPLFRKVGDPLSKNRPNGFMAFATSGRPPNFLCYSNEFMQYMLEQQRLGKIPKESKISMKEFKKQTN